MMIFQFQSLSSTGARWFVSPILSNTLMALSRMHPYCSYVDRKENLTYYFRNHALVDAFLDQFVTDGVQNLSTSEKRSTDFGGLNPQSPKKPASIDQRLPAEITPTTTVGGAGADMNLKTQTPVWQEGELRGNIEELIAAAYWMENKARGVRSPVGFKSKVRKRITSEGPNAEDWETLVLWRASQTKLAPEENQEEGQRASEKKQRLANAKQRYGAMEEAQQKEIESGFAAHLQANNKFAYKTYSKSGLGSGVVAGAFHEWLLGELQ